MPRTFTYEFLDSNQGLVDLTVTTRVQATDSTGFGPSYAVTAITGTLDGQTISGEVGTGGVIGTSSLGNNYDNAIFLSSATGAIGFGSADGIDVYGLEFTVGSDVWSVSGDDFHNTGLEFGDENQTTGFEYNLTLLSTDAPCYCPGTLILTDRGEVPVEALEIGDQVVTASGRVEAIRWLGRRSYARRVLAGRSHLLPIRFRAGCLGDGLPRRDLRVSRQHAMFLDGVLVPAGHLVNGHSIVIEPACEHVCYIHIELAQHDLILAEGAVSETFLDDDSRGLFENAREFARLYPGEARSGGYCVRRVESGFELEAIRRRLAASVMASALAA